MEVTIILKKRRLLRLSDSNIDLIEAFLVAGHECSGLARESYPEEGRWESGIYVQDRDDKSCLNYILVATLDLQAEAYDVTRLMVQVLWERLRGLGTPQEAINRLVQGHSRVGDALTNTVEFVRIED
jgi:hypothetical protein